MPASKKRKIGEVDNTVHQEKFPLLNDSAKKEISELINVYAGIQKQDRNAVPLIGKSLTGLTHEVLVFNNEYYFCSQQPFYVKSIQADHNDKVILETRILQSMNTGELYLLKKYELSKSSSYQERIELEVEFFKKLNLGSDGISNRNFDKTYYVLKRFEPGNDLTKLMDLDLATKEKIASLVINELIRLHALGIVHCDLKLKNIIYDEETNKVSIIDYDVALWLNGEGAKTTEIRGTFAHLPPEILEQSDGYTYNQATDIYSLGIAFQEWFGLEPQASSNLRSSSTLFSNIGSTPTVSDLVKIMTDENPAKRQIKQIQEGFESLATNDLSSVKYQKLDK